MQMVPDGEKRNEDISDIIGEGYKCFCDEIVSAFPPLVPFILSEILTELQP